MSKLGVLYVFRPNVQHFLRKEKIERQFLKFFDNICIYFYDNICIYFYDNICMYQTKQVEAIKISKTLY